MSILTPNRWHLSPPESAQLSCPNFFIVCLTPLFQSAHKFHYLFPIWLLIFPTCNSFRLCLLKQKRVHYKGTVLLTKRLLSQAFLSKRGGRLRLFLVVLYIQYQKKLAAALLCTVHSGNNIWFCTFWKPSKNNGPKRRGCSHAATLQSLQTMSDTSHRPAATKHTRVFAVCIPHRLNFASPILIPFLGLTGQTTCAALTYIPSNKPQEAIDLQRWTLKCCARKLSWVWTKVSNFHADLVTPFIGAKHGRCRRIVRSLCISKPWLAMR